MNVIQSCFKRYEKKYLLTQEQYQAVLYGMSSFMEPDAHPRYSISNIYYDNEHYDTIRASLERPVYKEKLRMRSYGVPGSFDAVFIELKKKYDGVVYKRRITMRMQDAAHFMQGRQKGDGSQINREIEYFMKLYQPEPKVFIAYDREAYAASDGSELRITFDTDLRCRSNNLDLRSGDYGMPIISKESYLMEIKNPGGAPLWLARLLSENNIFPTSFSKYGAYYKEYVLGGRSAEVKKEVALIA